MTVFDELRNLLLSNGANMVGIADLQHISADVRDNLPLGISIAVVLKPQIISEIKDGPTKQYYHEYERANRLLDEIGHCAVEFIKARGHQAKWFAATSVGIDSNTLSTRLPHKTVATLAGLGWIGKCALLVTRTSGSAVRITTVLTDAGLPTSHPMDTILCGKCTACVDACPSHAPSGKNWRKSLHRDTFFNAFACQKAARELTMERVGIRETLCGICIAVCPWTQKYIRRAN